MLSILKFSGIATLIAAYISYKINDMFYYSYIKILIDNTKICYCRKLDIFIKYDEYVNNPKLFIKDITN